MMVWLLLVVFAAFWENSISHKIPICKCVTENGVEGYCRSAKKCVGVQKFSASNCTKGLVCCTRGEISQKKCYEYAQLVYASDSAMSLMAHSTNSEKVDTCAIVAVPLIVGGEKVKPKEFPHQAVLGYGDAKDSKTLWECGGTLISENFVLTAAHCVLATRRPSSVRLGIIHLNDDLDNQQIYPIEDIIMHPNYHAMKKVNDIALVKISKNVTFTPYVRPACLDYSGFITENRAIATGFGLLSHGGKQSVHLLKVTLDILDKKVCYRLVKRKEKKGVQRSQICAGFLAGGKDTCQGDSGGPLQTIKRIPYCMYNVIGVTSYGSICGFEYSPAIYTRVWSFVPWIESLVWPDE